MYSALTLMSLSYMASPTGSMVSVLEISVTCVMDYIWEIFPEDLHFLPFWAQSTLEKKCLALFNFLHQTLATAQKNYISESANDTVCL